MIRRDTAVIPETEPPRKRLKADLTKTSGMITGTNPDGNEKFTVFYSNSDPFSNFYPAEFTLDDKTFNCSEQYFHFMKAGNCNTVMLRVIAPGG